ncbi:alginate lyase family protein [Pontibacter anaerobius]|uniref:Alginate lyase family protein n=1 Tax=Pontibacter anaerobius TaxID=2993940 RepID=A0ABT3RDV6_9BACT|nr:alginate lyase family protein [Pontibacter anaerobius]MCX2739940.1 alginate lyase family protein [Pontibacter anaerobius]
MNKRLKIILWYIFISLLYTFDGLSQVKPNTFKLNGEVLMQNKHRLYAGDKQVVAALQKLADKANRALNKPPYTVVNKTINPPSGNKHDYLSLSPYWWPNPLTPDGLPYIIKDGKTNPEANETKDKYHISNLSSDILLLGTAFYFTDDEKYAQKASELLHIFFIDANTKMSPHLNYAQAIRGVTDGRGTGLIETIHFLNMIDGIQLLEGSESFTALDKAALKDWFSSFLNWMLTSDLGKEAAKAPNNIGTYYDLQVIGYALFTDNKFFAKEYLQDYTLKRMDRQFKPDGSQPLELERSRSWTYCIKNINGWIGIANLGNKAGVDVWHYSTSDGKGIKQSILWLLPYAAGQKEWQYEEVSGIKTKWFLPIAQTATRVYNDSSCKAYFIKFGGAQERWNTEPLLMLTSD